MMRKVVIWVPAVVAAALLVVAPILIVDAPREATMGLVQKIFYFHVPCAWLCFMSAFVCAFGSGVQLFSRADAARKSGAAIGVAGGELAVLFGACTLISGPLWAHKAWGTWWQWDVRLTTTLLLWLLFIAYLFVRRYGGGGSDKLAAGLALLGAANVPLVYLSVSIWRTIHPKTSVVPSLQPGMRGPFWISLVAFTILFRVLLHARVGLEKARDSLDALHLDLEDEGENA
jgi:heme exporter protein C